MKTHLKKVMALLLSAAVALSMMSVPAFADDNPTGTGSATLADGTYTIDADHYAFEGGTGKARLTCTSVTIKDGQATGEFTASSANMSHVHIGTVSAESEELSVYDPDTDQMGADTFKIENKKVTLPVKLNEQTAISARTTAMSQPHWINYTYKITIDPSQKPDGPGQGGSDQPADPTDPTGPTDPTNPTDPAQPEEITDGTYTATGFKTDVTTDASGMIVVSKATVVIKDGKATAIVTMKGTGADRFYVSDTATKDTIIAEAVEEEKKEVGGKESNLLGGLILPESSAYTFWPVPITLGEPKVYAARSASHFAKQDKTPDKYYYVHDFQIDKENLKRVSDSTEIMTPQQDAQRYMDQYFSNGTISSDHADAIKGKGTNVTVPYYDTTGSKIGSFVFKRSSQFRAGWFIDSSILKTTYFSSTNLKKIRYPEGKNGTVTFSPKAAYRDSGMDFTATLKLYPADTGYDQYDGNGVYYDKEPLAERTFHITVQDKPVIDFDVTVDVTDMKTKEAIDGATIKVVDEADNTEITPNADGTFKLNSLKKYTISVSKEGFVAQGGAAEATKTGYSPAKEEHVVLSLLKEADSMHTVKFHVKDQLGEDVPEPVITVTRSGETVAPEADGSYRLYDGIQYNCAVSKDGYQESQYNYLKPTEDVVQEITIKKYLDSHTITLKVYDEDTSEELKDVVKSITVENKEVPANEDGSFTVPGGKQLRCVLSMEGYQSKEVYLTPNDFEPTVDYTFALKINFRNQLKNEIEKAKAQLEAIVEGDAPLEYPSGTKSTFQEAIAAAEAALTKEEGTEDSFQEALTVLKKAETKAANAQLPDEADVLVQVNQTAGEPGQLMELHVKGDTAKSHKYAKPSSHKKMVTILDVLVAVHEEMYGEAFDKKPLDYLEQYDFGMYVVTRIFGRETNQTSYRLNNSYVDHMGYQKTDVHSGDLVTIKIDKSYSDQYLYFDKVKEEAPAENFDVVLHTGDSKQPAQATGFQVTLANENGHEVSAVSDENGVLHFNFPEDGTYTVKSVSKEELKDPVTVPFLQVKAIFQQLATAKEKAQQEAADLVDLSDYRQAQQQRICDLQNQAREAIQNAASLEAIDKAMDELRTGVAEQKTDRQLLTEELAAAEKALQEALNKNKDAASQLADREAALNSLRSDLKYAALSKLKSKAFNGKTQVQKLVITMNGKRLTAGKDYAIAYASNKNIGTATVIITGKGSYRGTLRANFAINPAACKITKAKARKKTIKLKWKKPKSKLTGYQIMYTKSGSFKNAKTLTIQSAKKKSAKLKKLTRKKTFRIKMRAYTVVNGKTYYSKWSKKTVKTK